MVDIGSLSGLTGAAQQSLQKSNARIQAVIATLLGGVKATLPGDDVASLSIATQLQSHATVLKQASGNLAQASSLTEVASGGITQVQGILIQLKDLAQKAQSPTLNSNDRAALNQQFKALVSNIDQIVSNTGFSGQKLLDGSLSGDSAISLASLLSSSAGDDVGNSLSIDNLSSSALFSNKSLNLLSSDSAQQAIATLSAAITKVTAAAADVGSFQQAVNYAAASVDSARVNQEAAQSLLSGEDFAANASALSLAIFQQNAGVALAAQGNRLPPSMLELLN